MQQLTQAGQNAVSGIAQRYNLSQDAVVHMLIAVNNGGGSMAQFNCPELGGSGQWMRGGMTMVGDMFNYGLKMTVDNLCNELSACLANMQVFPPLPQGSYGNAQWWPGDLGSPFSSGAQNNIRYAVFPQRLAVELNGQVSVYDTLDHQIGGVSQQQGGDSSLTFSSQYGTISVNSLPLLSGGGMEPAVSNNFASPQYTPEIRPFSDSAINRMGSMQSAAAGAASTQDMLDLIQKLAQLRDAGVLTQDEFESKKSDLLRRI